MNIPLINIQNNGVDQVDQVDFPTLEKESLISVTDYIKKPPVAISIGHYQFKGETYPTPFGSYGDFSCIVGASKSMKTFFKSALVAGYIGGNSNNYFSNIQGHDSKGKYIIDIDTEQSLYHTQRVARRVCEMVGTNPDLYRSYALRDKDPITRFEFVNWLVTEKYKGKIGLLSVDGSADLLDNVNDLERSNHIVNTMMKWTKQGNLHLITILHRNHGSMKPTGHLGSAILKKAETVAFVQKEDNIVRVTAEYTRNFPFDEFAFELNDNHLPQEAFNTLKF